jgi:hypothetical protein
MKYEDIKSGTTENKSKILKSTTHYTQTTIYSI